jgi:serine/threonine-protein kinase
MGSATAVDRPTEVAIGMAAADLFRALPKPLQKQLGDLPSLLEKLEDDARSMRKRVETLGEQLSKLGGPEGSASSTLGTQAAIADRREQIAIELGSARDASSKRLASAVAALENIRLDLLRLQAGAGSMESLTSSIEAARHIGTTIDATLEGREDTERILRGESSPPEGHAAASTSR